MIFSFILLAIISDVAFGFSGYMGSGLSFSGKILIVIFSILPIILTVLIRKLTKIFTYEVQEYFQSANSIQFELERIATQINRLEGKMLKLKSTQIEPVSKENYCEPNLDNDNNGINNDLSQLELEVNRYEDYKLDLNSKNAVTFSDWDLILRALHFPKDKTDSEGFKALSLIRKDIRMNALLTASEDFLTLLAQDGIYLDDLEIDPPPVESWIEFTKNNRNNLVKKLNCLKIDQFISQLESRMRSDIVFRDANLVLLRRFDQFLREKLKNANDAQIFYLASTRTGRAFMIAGQISKAF